jgi:DNA topoisomerase-1
MAKILIIESPGKIKKIKSFLPNDYSVVASVGHIRDLDKSCLSIDENYNPIYVLNSDKTQVIANIKKQCKDKKIFIATDIDYEGEAIAESIRSILKTKNYDRILFNAITYNAIMDAINNPQKIDQNMVYAQQTRRILDRLVGYKISPILQKQFNFNKLAAGRVQSVIVKILLEKEKKINDFNIKDLGYEIFGRFNANIYCTLYKNNEIYINNNKNATKELLLKLGNANWKCENIVKKKSFSYPSAPFITATLQQAASSKLNMSITTVMSVAQKLYENGYITYMRTDSPMLSIEAHNDIKKFINSTFDSKYYHYKQYASNNGQEAHEAIRPTHITTLEVTNLDNYANNLYKLIWKKTVSSQMSPAEFEITQIIINPNITNYMMIGSLKKIIFDGYLIVYNDLDDEKYHSIDITKKTPIIMNELLGKEKIEHPPLRYNEANLVKKLEKLGIGRPSTYATMISKIQDHKYAEIINIEGSQRNVSTLTFENNKIKEKISKVNIGGEKKKLVPTPLGEKITDFLNDKFSCIMDYEFTSKLESDLDKIAKGESIWHVILKDYDIILNQCINKIQPVSIAITLFDNIGNYTTGKPIYFLVGKFGPCIKTLIGKKDLFVSVKEKPDIDTAIKLINNKRMLVLIKK